MTATIRRFIPRDEELAVVHSELAALLNRYHEMQEKLYALVAENAAEGQDYGPQFRQVEKLVADLYDERIGELETRRDRLQGEIDDDNIAQELYRLSLDGRGNFGRPPPWDGAA